MSEQKDIEDVWDELLEQLPLQDGKSDTHMGLKNHFERETSGEYIALKSHDLYDAFTKRDPTDRYHKPITEVELVPQDVEDFFDDLLDEMLSAASLSYAKPPPRTQVVRPTPKMTQNQLARQHVRRQLLLWLLGIETLEGVHQVQLTSQDDAHPIELLVIDGKLCMAMKYRCQPLLDTQLKREHPALCERIRITLTGRQTPEESQWDIVLLPQDYILDAVEHRALMELLLRLLKHSATQHITMIQALQTKPAQLERITPLSFSPIDFFTLADDHLQSDMSDLPSRCTNALAEVHGAKGWLMHHTHPLHPFDALIAHTSRTPHTIHAASRATLFGNAARQLIEALGFRLHHTCLCTTTPALCSLVLTDEHYISSHDYPLGAFAHLIGEVMKVMSEYPSAEPEARGMESEALPHEMQEQDEEHAGLDLLAQGMPECEAVVVCSLNSADNDRVIWKTALLGEPGEMARAFVVQKSRVRAVRAAIEQFKIVSADHHQINEFYVFDQTQLCLLMPMPGRPHHMVIWLCKLESNPGMIRARARHNLSQVPLQGDEPEG